MIVKRNFKPHKVLYYVRTELTLSILLTLSAYLLHARGITTVSLPFSVAAILGSALAIFIAFRNNTAYSRWWEARTVWANLHNSSRIFARQIIANADNAVATGKATPEKALNFKREMVYRQIAFAHALRLLLRGQRADGEFDSLLSESELAGLIKAENPPNLLLLTQGIRIKNAIREELLGAFDNISLEPTLASFTTWQGACERIKQTPLLRHYDYFTRVFLYVFMLLLPFCLIGDFSRMGIRGLMIPISIVISFVFATIGKVGEVNEDPFENTINDVPLTAVCNTIERELKEMLGEKKLPERAIPRDGYLF